MITFSLNSHSLRTEPMIDNNKPSAAAKTKTHNTWSRKTPPADARQIANSLLMKTDEHNKDERKSSMIKSKIQDFTFPSFDEHTQHHDHQQIAPSHDQNRRSSSSSSPFQLRTRQRSVDRRVSLLSHQKNKLALNVSDLQQAHQQQKNNNIHHHQQQKEQQSNNTNKANSNNTYAINGHVRPSDIKLLVHNWIDATDAGFKANSMLEYLQYQKMKKEHDRKQQQQQQQQNNNVSSISNDDSSHSPSKLMNISNLSDILLLADDDDDHKQEGEEDDQPLIMSGDGKGFKVFESLLVESQQQQELTTMMQVKRPPKAPHQTQQQEMKTTKSSAKETNKISSSASGRKSLSSFLTSQQRIVKEQQEYEDLLMKRRRKLMNLV